jgi:hypothetical protein
VLPPAGILWEGLAAAEAAALGSELDALGAVGPKEGDEASLRSRSRSASPAPLLSDEEEEPLLLDRCMEMCAWLCCCCICLPSADGDAVGSCCLGAVSSCLNSALWVCFS